MKKTAFTLVELLVVIAVIAALMSILMPALAAARQQAKAVVCLGNLRQMALAAEVFTAANDGYYPNAYIKDPDPYDSLAIIDEWDFKQIKNWNTGRITVEPGILWQTDTIGKVQQCPAFNPRAENKNTGAPYCGYNYNTSYIGRDSLKLTPVKTAKVSQLKHPSATAIFGDGGYYGGADKFMRSPNKSPFENFTYPASGTQSFRHSGKTNISWCDGHADSLKKCFDNGNSRIIRFNTKAGDKTGFISADNNLYDLD